MVCKFFRVGTAMVLCQTSMDLMMVDVVFDTTLIAWVSDLAQNRSNMVIYQCHPSKSHCCSPTVGRALVREWSTNTTQIHTVTSKEKNDSIFVSFNVYESIKSMIFPPAYLVGLEMGEQIVGSVGSQDKTLSPRINSASTYIQPGILW